MIGNILTPDEGENICEKCGGEMSEKMAGDESYRKCVDCGHIDLS